MKILSLSGFVPEQICDVVRFTHYEGDHKIMHYCGYASDFISQVLNDASIDGAVFPKSCDSSRVIVSYLSSCRKFLYQIPVPARNDEAAIDYLAYSIEQYQRAVEKYYGINEINVKDRIILVNKRNEIIKQMYNQLGNTVIYSKYLLGIHAMLKQPLERQTLDNTIMEINGGNKRVYLVGSFLSNCDLVKDIERAGMIIVGDNLTESKRLFSAPPVSLEGNLYNNIAKSILYNRVSPTQNQFDQILRYDIDEITSKDIDGVIYITQKYCEPYDFLYSIYKKALDRINIPILKINVSDSTDGGRLETLLGAFVDII